MSKLFGKSSKTTQSSTTPTAYETLPDYAQQLFESLVSQGQNLATDTSLFTEAGLTDEQQSALSTLVKGLSPTSAQDFQSSLSTFYDPYEEQVVQNVIKDIQRTGAGQLSDIGSLASGAGAFGGQRQALLEAETLKNIQQQAGQAASELRSAGFQSAADRALSDIARSQELAPTLFSLGEVQRGINTTEQQAPLTANQYLANLAALIPTGGGTTSSGYSRGASQGYLADIANLARAGGGAMKGYAAL